MYPSEMGAMQGLLFLVQESRPSHLPLLSDRNGSNLKLSANKETSSCHSLSDCNTQEGSGYSKEDPTGILPTPPRAREEGHSAARLLCGFSCHYEGGGLQSYPSRAAQALMFAPRKGPVKSTATSHPSDLRWTS